MRSIVEETNGLFDDFKKDIISVGTNNKIYKYSVELAERVCDFVSCGGFLIDLKKYGGPSSSQISLWRRQDQKFHYMLCVAEEERATVFFEKAMKLPSHSNLSTKEGLAEFKARLKTLQWGAQVSAKKFAQYKGHSTNINVNAKKTELKIITPKKKEEIS